MKKIKLLILLLVGNVFPVVCQTPMPVLKTMRDSVFNVGDIIKTPQIIFYPNLGPQLFIDSTFNDSAFSIGRFLQSHPKLAIELGVHTDYTLSGDYNIDKSSERAKRCAEFIVHEMKIPQERLIPRGYGEYEPTFAYQEVVLPSKKIIKKGTRLNQRWIDVNYPPMKGKEDYDFIMQMNRRVELKVLSTNYPKYKTLKDSVFEVGDIIKMPLILFNLDQHDLNHPSNPKDSLNQVVEFLKKYSYLTIELGVHTDYRSPAEYNTSLSKNRAKACADYIVNEQKIPADRVSYIGYGETKPFQLPFNVTLPSGKIVYAWTTLTEQWIDKNYPAKESDGDYEFLMKLNRRIELKVLSTNFGK